MGTQPLTGEIRLRVGDAVRPGLRVEALRTLRLRIAAQGEPVFWARRARACAGVWTLRGREPIQVVPPIRAAEARRRPDASSWLGWFVGELLESERSPLQGGTWCLSEMQPGRKTEHLEPADPECFVQVRGLRRALKHATIRYENWIVNACNVHPLRAFSPSESGRVKAWKKHVRNGTLPPVLLWWISALNGFVILDGHDRLVAADTLDSTPRALALWQEQAFSGPHTADKPHPFTRIYERLFEADPPLEARRGLNAALASKYWAYRSPLTFSRAVRDGSARWREEVLGRAAHANPDDLAALLGEPAPQRRPHAGPAWTAAGAPSASKSLRESPRDNTSRSWTGEQPS